jgi:hypothetical protein
MGAFTSTWEAAMAAVRTIGRRMSLRICSLLLTPTHLHLKTLHGGPEGNPRVAEFRIYCVSASRSKCLPMSWERWQSASA